MRIDEIADEVNAWQIALRDFASTRWQHFEREANDHAQAIAAAFDWPTTCRGCGRPIHRAELGAALLDGDRDWRRRQLTDTAANHAGRAFLWGRVLLVLAMLDGFCSEHCVPPGARARRSMLFT